MHRRKNQKSRRMFLKISILTILILSFFIFILAGTGNGEGDTEGGFAWFSRGRNSASAGELTGPVLRERYDKIVWLDPGHGGRDQGTSAIHNGVEYLEKDIVLHIVQMTYELFQRSDSGIKAMLSRSYDITIDPLDRPALWNDSADLVVSVHADFYEGPTAHQVSGVQVYFSEDNNQNTGRVPISSAQFAQIMQDHLVRETGAQNRGIRGDRNFAVCTRSTVPAVLIETGFMSNPEELARLVTPEYQRQIATAIYHAIVEAFEFWHHAIPADSALLQGIDCSIFSTPISLGNITDTQYLKLVNPTHAVRSPANAAQLVTLWPDIPARTAYVSLHETAFSAMVELFAAAGRANFNDLFIASGHRTYEEQSYLYQNAANRDYVAVPGHSEHHLGLAADILSNPNSPTMRGTEEARWLAANAPAFGFILRYPEDKQDITQVPYEPWHFRYVGQIHAWYMGLHNFVLEEYIQYLQTRDGFQVEFNGKTYHVLYQRPENGMILVPGNLDFWVSSANTGGYIVTAWG